MPDEVQGEVRLAANDADALGAVEALSDGAEEVRVYAMHA